MKKILFTILVLIQCFFFFNPIICITYTAQERVDYAKYLEAQKAKGEKAIPLEQFIRGRGAVITREPEDVAKLKEDLKSREAQLVQLQKQLDDLLKGKKPTTDLAAATQDSSVKELQKEIEKARAEIVRLKQAGAAGAQEPEDVAKLKEALSDQEAQLVQLQKQLDDLLKGKKPTIDLAAAAQDPREKALRKEIEDLRAEVARLKARGITVEGAEEENPETIFWSAKAAEVVNELQRRLEQVRQYQREAEDALAKFKLAPYEQDQDILFQYLQNLNQSIRHARARIIELNDLRFGDKLSNAHVRVPNEYKNFPNNLDVLLDQLERFWRPQQNFGLLPWVATELPIKNKIDELRKVKMGLPKGAPHLAPANPYQRIESVSLEYKPGEIPAEKPVPGKEEAGTPPPPPPPPAPKPKVEEKPVPSILEDIVKGAKLKSKEQRLRSALEKAGIEKQYIDKVLADKSIATEKEALDRAKFLKSQEKLGK